jgi:hypothetical protein
MPFKIRYQVNIDFVGAGAGPMEALSPASGQGLQGGGVAQTKAFVGNPAIIPLVIGAGAGQTLTGGDVTTLTNAMAADMATQINAALTQLNTWPTGGP